MMENSSKIVYNNIPPFLYDRFKDTTSFEGSWQTLVSISTTNGDITMLYYLEYIAGPLRMAHDIDDQYISGWNFPSLFKIP